MADEIIINGDGTAVGRFSTHAAKQALLGKNVFVLNCNTAVFTGNKNAIIATYHQKITRGGTTQKGPYYSVIPEKLVKRTIRGMLPKNDRGREALKRIKCFNEIPKEYESKEQKTFDKAKPPFIELKKLGKLL